MVAGLDYKMLMTEVGVADTNMNTLPQAPGTSQTPVICLNTQDGQSREVHTGPGCALAGLWEGTASAL